MKGPRLPGRAGLGVVAIGLVVLLVGASLLAYAGGQTYLAVVGAIGGLLTAWAVVASFGRN